MKRPLTAKQRRFADVYDGNGVEAARAAGYQGSYAVLGQVAHENLKKPEIANAIAAREKKLTAKPIATREQRQAFWTDVMNDMSHGLLVRLRASELLGKSQADFTEKHEHSLDGSVTVLISGITKGGA